MTGLIQHARDAIAQRLEQFRNRQFLDATLAASALVAMADGKVSISELNMVDRVLKTIHELNIYDPHVAVDLYRNEIEALQAEPAAAREKILLQVGKLRNGPEAAEMLIKVCIAIAKSDETVTDTERTAINDLCDAMGLPREQAEV